MTDTHESETTTATTADDAPDVEAGTEDEVEGFNQINTTRDNIPRRPRPASATAVGNIGISGASQLAIKENGIK